jgi:hypothetical protein
MMLVLYDLADPEGHVEARSTIREWGRSRVDLYPMSPNHILLAIRPEASDSSASEAA